MQTRNKNTMKLILSGKKPHDWNNLSHKAGKATEAAFMNDGFDPVDIEFTEKELTNFVKTYAMVLSHLKKNKRDRISVKDGFNVVGLDFDNSDKSIEQYGLLTIESAKQRLNNIGISYFIYTTPTHSPERPKFRVLIPTKEVFYNRPRTTIDIHEHDKIKNYFTTLFPECDQSVFQPERLFFGNNNAETFFCNSKPYLDVATLPEVEIQSNFKTSKNNQEVLEFDTTLVIKLSDGTSYRLEDVQIDEKLPIYCPFHDDNTPSAFINPDTTKFGKLFIHCSSCGKTWVEKNQHKYNNTVLFRHTDTGDLFRESNDKYLPFMNSDQRDAFFYQAKLPYEKREFRLGIPEFRPRFLPTHKEGYIGNNEFNVFKLPKYVNRNLPKSQKTLEELQSQAPMSYKLLKNVFIVDNELLKFLKWNAYILQTGRKAQTSWIIQTTNQRIGKNAICELLLQPLYGEHQYSLIQGKDIGSSFNSLDYGCWLRVYDEARIYNNRGVDEYQKEILKNITTEKTTVINIKNVSEFKADNAMNFIFLTNNKDALIIDTTDNRYNIVNNDTSTALMEQPWWPGKDAFEAQIAKEVQEFANFLMSLEVDEKTDVLETLKNDAKKAIQEYTISQEEQFCIALRANNADYFDIEGMFMTKYIKSDFPAIEKDLLYKSIQDGNGIPQKFTSIILQHHFPKKSRARMFNDLKKYGFRETTRDKKKVWVA